MTLDAAFISATLALLAATAALWITGIEAQSPHPDLDRAPTSLATATTVGIGIATILFVTILVLSRNGVIIALIFAAIGASAKLSQRNTGLNLKNLYIFKVPIAFVALLLSVYAWGRALSV